MSWAVREAIRIVDQRYTDFEQAVRDSWNEVSHIEDLKQRAQAASFLSKFVSGMWDVAAASYHWQMETNRYRSETSPFADLRLKLSA
jgi:hypothetical protein